MYRNITDYKEMGLIAKYSIKNYIYFVNYMIFDIL